MAGLPARRASSEAACDELWRSLRAQMLAALKGAAPAQVRDAAWSLGRSLALGEEAGLTEILACLRDRCDVLAGDLDEAACGRLRFVELELIEAAATGFTEGMAERHEELDRRLERLEPEAAQGALRPQETLRQLAIELQRCERMQLPLGLIALIVTPPDGDLGRAVREGLRQYDLVGRLEDGHLALCLPDVSRAGLLSAAERLNERLCRAGAACEGRRLQLALLHLDSADLELRELLRLLEQAIQTAASADDYVSWA